MFIIQSLQLVMNVKIYDTFHRVKMSNEAAFINICSKVSEMHLEKLKIMKR